MTLKIVKDLLRKFDFEALLDVLEDSLIVRVADERDAETLGTETTRTTDTVKIRVGLVRHVVVDSNIDTLNVDTTTEDISRNADTSLEILELLVSLDTLILADTRVDRSAGEVTLAEELVELGATLSRSHKDDDLVELKRVKEVVELSVLLTLLQLHVVLLETVQGELLLIVDVDLQRALHELLAGEFDIL